jgi:phytoene dehydrogenase-like protein
MMKFMPILSKWGRVAIPDFIARMKSEDLKEAFRRMYPSELGQDFPVMGMMMMLGFMHKKSAGYPLGGSLEFAKAVEKRYLSLGGKIRYGFKVDKIIVKDGRAAGIEGMGQEIPGDIVISAADGHDTLFGMLEGKHLTPKLKDAYKKMPLFPSLVYVSLGIRKDLRSVPSMQYFPIAKPIVMEDGERILEWLSLRLYHFDPSMAPAGGTAAIVMIPTHKTEWWTSLRSKDPARYRTEKERIGKEVVDAVDGFLGGIRDKVEVVDVATPATVVRYTNNWKGSFEGFLPTRKTMTGGLDRTIPGLKDFYMVGQWVHPGGGLPPCGMDGLSISRRLCKEDGKKFKIPENI